MKANIKAFDAPFFSITPTEAASMDPQQRMLIECVYTACENAGITMDRMQGSNTGTYCGTFVWDYRDILRKDMDVPSMYSSTGTIPSTLAGRCNWFYNFKGPSMNVDTACSSSMVALHQAINGLKMKDCDVVRLTGPTKE
jgi:acyl transferase domain-containing protein